MKKLKYFMIVISFAVLCSIAAAGCGPIFDCSGYIQAMLDATYKGETDDYAEITGSETEAVEDLYEDFIEHETEIMLRFLGIAADDVIPSDVSDEIREIVRSLCSQVSYSVGEANRNGEVSITVNQMIIFTTLYDEVYAYSLEFKERNNNYEFEEYTDEEFAREYLDPLVDLLEEYAQEPIYADASSVTVTVYQDEDGNYTISEDDVTVLYNALISYSLSAYIASE